MALTTAERSRRWREHRCATDNYMKLKQEMESLRNEIRHEIIPILLELKQEMESLRNDRCVAQEKKENSSPDPLLPSPLDSPSILPFIPSLEKKEKNMSTRVYDPRFARWYEGYPEKVGKGAAERSFLKALKLGATEEELRAGLSRYVEHKPHDRPWCNPATWLNQERWNDEYENGIDKDAEYEAGRVEFMRKESERYEAKLASEMSTQH